MVKTALGTYYLWRGRLGSWWVGDPDGLVIPSPTFRVYHSPGLLYFTYLPPGAPHTLGHQLLALSPLHLVTLWQISASLFPGHSFSSLQPSLLFFQAALDLPAFHSFTPLELLLILLSDNLWVALVWQGETGCKQLKNVSFMGLDSSRCRRSSCCETVSAIVGFKTVSCGTT